MSQTENAHKNRGILKPWYLPRWTGLSPFTTVSEWCNSLKYLYIQNISNRGKRKTVVKGTLPQFNPFESLKNLNRGTVVTPPIRYIPLPWLPNFSTVEGKLCFLDLNGNGLFGVPGRFRGPGQGSWVRENVQNEYARKTRIQHHF